MNGEWPLLAPMVEQAAWYAILVVLTAFIYLAFLAHEHARAGRLIQLYQTLLRQIEKCVEKHRAGEDMHRQIVRYRAVAEHLHDALLKEKILRRNELPLPEIPREVLVDMAKKAGVTP